MGWMKTRKGETRMGGVGSLCIMVGLLILLNTFGRFNRNHQHFR
ncbi:MAG: hypothetical protein ACFWUM_03705 [Eubacteriales bacterium]